MSDGDAALLVDGSLAFCAEDNKITVYGTLKKVEEYEAFDAGASGYFLPFKVTGLNEESVVYLESKDGISADLPDGLEGNFKKITKDSFDGDKTYLNCIQQISADNRSFRVGVDYDGGGTVSVFTMTFAGRLAE